MLNLYRFIVNWRESFGRRSYDIKYVYQITTEFTRIIGRWESADRSHNLVVVTRDPFKSWRS